MPSATSSSMVSSGWGQRRARRHRSGSIRSVGTRLGSRVWRRLGLRAAATQRKPDADERAQYLSDIRDAIDPRYDNHDMAIA